MATCQIPESRNLAAKPKENLQQADNRRFRQIDRSSATTSLQFPCRREKGSSPGELLGLIDLNPLRAGLAEKPEAYR